MVHIDHAALMDGVGNFLLQGLDQRPPGSGGQEQILLGAPVVVVEDDVRVNFPGHQPDVGLFVLADLPEHPGHFLRVLQIVHQRVLHPHQVVAAFKQPAAEHESHKFFLAVHALRHLLGRAEVQPFQGRHLQVVLPMFNIGNYRILLGHPGMRSRGIRRPDVHRTPAVPVFFAVPGRYVPEHHRVRHQGDGLHNVAVVIRLPAIEDGHGVFTGRHCHCLTFVSFPRISGCRACYNSSESSCTARLWPRRPGEVRP